MKNWVLKKVLHVSSAAVVCVTFGARLARNLVSGDVGTVAVVAAIAHGTLATARC